MCRPKTNGAVRAVAAAVALAALLAGCSSDMYYDRRETVTRGSGDAVAANMVQQMVDPWPRYSNDKNIAFNGERMQRAVECYRKDRVTTPVDIDPTSTTGAGQTPQTSAFQCVGQMTSGSMPPVPGASLGAATPGGTPTAGLASAAAK